MIYQLQLVPARNYCLYYQYHIMLHLWLISIVECSYLKCCNESVIIWSYALITFFETDVHHVFVPLPKNAKNWPFPVYNQMDNICFVVHGTLKFHIQTAMSHVPWHIFIKCPMSHSPKKRYGAWDIAVCTLNFNVPWTMKWILLIWSKRKQWCYTA